MASPGELAVSLPTLAGELRRRALARPDETAIRFTEAGSPAPSESWTWAIYWQHASRVAAGLAARGIGPGDRVLVLAPDVRAAVAAHFGAWAAGVTPTHVGLPYRLGDPAAFIAQLHGTAERLRSRALLVSSTVAPFVPVGAAPGATQAIAIDHLLAADGAADIADPDSLAPPDLLQLTSGSTGQPRAVRVPQARLIAHLEAIAAGLPAEPGDSGVTWLPLHHDMGLIGGLLYPFFTDFPVHLLSPLCFQTQPMSWLTALSQARATHTAGPPSAFAVLLRLARRAADAGLRLDRLRCAMIGAEPIAAALLHGFADAFAPCGLRREAFFPVYGLAEATVAVTFPRVLAPTRVERVDRLTLERAGRAEPASDGPALDLVGTGAPLPGTTIRIVDATGAPLAERRVGEIQVQAPTLMAGYDGEAEATRAAFDGDWLRTGDLGFVSEGELFVTGRLKDVLIKAGHNVYPEPIEATAATVEGVRPGCVVAAGVRSELHGTERIVVVAETRLAEEAWPALGERLRAALQSTGVVIDEIVWLPPGALPKTTSGKLRRAAVVTWLCQRVRTFASRHDDTLPRSERDDAARKNADRGAREP